MIPILSTISVVLLLIFASSESFSVSDLERKIDHQNQIEDLPEKVEKKSGVEVQNILNMLEDAMNEAPKGSRPKQVRYSVVGKRNYDDLNDILKQIEFQLDDKSSPNGNSVIPVRFSLTGKR